MRVCLRCSIPKRLSGFVKHPRRKGGRDSVCKTCKNTRCRERYAEDALFKKRQDANSRGWWKSHPKEVAAIRQKFNRRHPKRPKEYRKRWLSKPGRKQENMRLAQNFRTRVRRALSSTPKLVTSLNLLGCSMESFRAHLEKQFRPGMSWQTYGFWQIDHIKPCASFDLKDPGQQKACFHFSNQRPLWKCENLKKGSRL